MKTRYVVRNRLWRKPLIVVQVFKSNGWRDARPGDFLPVTYRSNPVTKAVKSEDNIS